MHQQLPFGTRMFMHRNDEVGMMEPIRHFTRPVRHSITRPRQLNPYIFRQPRDRTRASPYLAGFHLTNWQYQGISQLVMARAKRHVHSAINERNLVRPRR